MAETYRSYVVRVKRPALAADTVQVDVEDLIGGGRVAVNGEVARSLAERLRSLIVEPPRPGSGDGPDATRPEP